MSFYFSGKYFRFICVAVHISVVLPQSLNVDLLPKNRCQSLNGESGWCIPLQQCPILREKAGKKPNLKRIAGYICGFSKGCVVACCPNESKNHRNEKKTTDLPTKLDGWFYQNPKSNQLVKNVQFLIDKSNENLYKNDRKPVGTLSEIPPKKHNNRHLVPQYRCGVQVSPNIYGGRKTELGEFPWLALLGLKRPKGRNNFICGGTLISPRYVLTAAHCVRRSGNKVVDKVRLGEYNLQKVLDCEKNTCTTPQDIEIEEIIIHPKFSAFRKMPFQNDIALLRLKKLAVLSFSVHPICLPFDELQNKDYSGQRMWTAGWGTTEQSKRSNVKLKVKLPVISPRKCSKIYPRFALSSEVLCAGGERKKDSCTGDSGGPILKQDEVQGVVRWIIQGIVSTGTVECGRPGKPGIYTRVGSYLDWILDNLRE